MHSQRCSQTKLFHCPHCMRWRPILAWILLETTPVGDLQLEALLTAARRSILALCDAPSEEADSLLPFA